MPTMTTVPGYGITATYQDDTLTVEGNNKAARMALAGQDHDKGPVVIPRGAVQSVEWKPAGRITNGNLTVHTVDGRKVQLHFLRKHADGMAGLARALGGNPE